MKVDTYWRLRVDGAAAARTSRLVGRVAAISGAVLAVALASTAEASAAVSQSYFKKLTGAGQSLAEARGAGAVAATLPSGEVLIAGGWNGSSFAPTAELFNPAKDTFTKLTGPDQSPIEPRQGAVAASLPSGEMLIAGSITGSTASSSAELFNPVTDTFSKLTSSLLEPRYLAVAAALPSGEVLIAGGEDPGTEGERVTAELFNPVTGAFSRTAPLTEGRAGSRAVTLSSGQVLILGGYPGSRLRPRLVPELFNPTTDSFSQLTGEGQSPLEGRQGALAVTLPSGQVLVAGGNGNGVTSEMSAELFDPSTYTFSKLEGPGQSLTEARDDPVAALLPSGEVLIAGGVNRGGDLSSAELFVPAAQARISAGSFGEETVGERSSSENLTVENVGAQPLEISGAALSGANASAFLLTGDACEGMTLTFRQRCTISVSLTPTSAGSLSATLMLADNEAEPGSVLLSGGAVAGQREHEEAATEREEQATVLNARQVEEAAVKRRQAEELGAKRQAEQAAHKARREREASKEKRREKNGRTRRERGRTHRMQPHRVPKTIALALAHHSSLSPSQGVGA